MNFLKHVLIVSVIAFAAVGASALFGQSDDAGLFGAIIGVGIYAAHGIKGEA